MDDSISSNQQSPLTRAEYAARIGGEWRRGVLSIIETGRLLNDAKQTLPGPEFDEMVAADLPFPETTTSMLRTVAERFGGVLYTERLPPHWMTLYLLTRLPPGEFDRRLADGTINPSLQQREVRGWVQKGVTSRRSNPRGMRAAPAKGRSAPPPTPPDDNGAEPAHEEESVQPPDAVESSPEKDPNPRGDQAETRSTENSDGPRDEVDSVPIASAEAPGPQELVRCAPAADAIEEAFCAMLALWRRAPQAARVRLFVFARTELQAALDKNKHRGEAGEAHGPGGPAK